LQLFFLNDHFNFVLGDTFAPACPYNKIGAVDNKPN
jgi:hypothetical protein